MPQDHTGSLTQSSIFLASEGDGWFNRNRQALHQKTGHHETGIVKRALEPFKPEIKKILEIGCSNGVKLKDLCEFFDAKGEGIDPSADAIAHGNQAFSDEKSKAVNLQVATASRLPFKDTAFDLVYFGFCLYLVDRSEVLQAVAEADRVLKNGGFLAILDFDPTHRHKRSYIHQPGLFSYKTAHQDFFTTGGHYYLVAKESFSHATPYFSKDSDERVSMCILYKEPTPY